MFRTDAEVLARLVLIGLLAGVQPNELIVDVQIHGNVLTSDADVIQIAGIATGMTLDERTLDDAAARLRASKKFEQVDVLKRFASIADLTQISVVIVVDEGPVTLQSNGSVKAGADQPPSIVRAGKGAGGFMFMPILKFEDGYGLSYGVRAAMPEVGGKGNRLSFPATWGGEKRAAAEFDRDWHGVLSRTQAGIGLTRRKNPFFNEHDDRSRVWLRGERDIARAWRVGATTAWQHVSFAGETDRFVSAGGDVTFDTRIDPVLSRNAIYARAAWDHLAFENVPAANRTEIDLRGYIGLIGQSVLIIRGQRQDSDHALPPYLNPLLGGTENLRGFKAGAFAGDTLVGASADLRIPMTSPLSFAKLGISAFFDTASVFNKGQHVRDQHFQRGTGGGVWISAAFLRLDFYVAHGLGESTRAHFATSVLF